MKIQEIQTEFLREASSAPSLFSDLAKVELYIAESYRSRAFIELLQNADDSGASKFLVRQVGKQLFVANDGHSFTQHEMIALCRSGSSNKRRGSGTIGYRGIGFKSVAGIAHEIDVISANSAFRFSKAITRQQLNIETDVPLIRIPHPIELKELSSVSLVEQLLLDGMNTVFILSGLDERMIAEEADAFDESAMLFLNNVSQVEIELPSVKRNLNRNTVHYIDGLNIEQIENNNEQFRWLVSSHEEGCERVAFALDADMIVPAPPSKSVIHAFMPTTEFSGALLKINGNFSTDPSRKSVDLDDTSLDTFERCVELLAKALCYATERCILPGIFSPFILASPVEGRFRKRLRDSLLSNLDDLGFCIAGVRSSPLEVRLRPDWLPYSDYEKICRDLPHIDQATLSQHPQLPDFLKWLGARLLTIEEGLSLFDQTTPSPIGRAQTFARLSRQYRYDLTADKLDIIGNTPLLPVEGGGALCVRDFSNQIIDSDFLEYIKQSNEIEDVRYLAKRLGLPISIINPIEDSPQKNLESQHQANSSKCESVTPPQALSALFKAVPAIKAWRSAEQNTFEWLSALADVLTVKDVSQANVGYDLEVFKHNGEFLYVEVKSVPRFGEAFRLTNNEHATAYQLGDAYFLAIVINSGNTYEIRLIQNPIRSLMLEKRCEQWSWYCENYLEKLIEYKEIEK
ncbi:MAG: DUF3883 domain-containing protein [Dechloromonas sp.]|uniref:DUF3883 domain-containing protein n=1 Tax=Candidatus Dechloromonas phosphorivorans TaxID=2899244 RepID=A0A935K2Z7_9RHOO|nr:DUF3883 domain-containing protein [Candidatus Dechloromonas phosphorivorans]